MKKVMITILASLTLVSATPVMAASGFSDVPDTNWAAPAITFMVDKQIVGGYADGTFKPEKPVTKAEFIHMFHKLFPNIGGKADYTVNFVDLKGNWASEDFNAVMGYNIWAFTDHFSNDGKKQYLAPNKQLTRWDVAIIVGMLTRELEVDTNGNWTATMEQMMDTITTFKDIQIRPFESEPVWLYTPVILTDKSYEGSIEFLGDVANTQADSIYTVLNNDIMAGANGKFRPMDKVTRAEAVTILQRVYTALENK